MLTFVIKGIIPICILDGNQFQTLQVLRGKNCSVTFWQITTKEAFNTRKPSHKTLFLKAADIICPSLLPSRGSVGPKPTTSSQRTSRLQAAVGPHSGAAAVFSLLLGRKRKNAVFTKNRHSQSISERRPCPPLHLRLLFHNRVVSHPLKLFLLLNAAHIILFRSGRLREIHTEQMRDRRFGVIGERGFCSCVFEFSKVFLR